MSDNVQLDAGSGGETIKTVQKSGAHVSVSAIDVGNHDTDSVALIGNAGVYMPVTGAVADNTTTSDNPVLVGAKYLATGTAVDDGDAAHLLTDKFRQLRTVLFSKDSNQEFSFHTADFDTNSANPAVDVDFTSCIGIAVAGTGGAVALTGTTVGDDTGLDVNIVNAAITLAPLPAGTNNIGDVDVVSLPALPAGTNNIGDVDVVSLPALPAGTNNIGDVDVVSLPELPAGTNNIGDVDIASLPALPAGANNIGSVNIGTMPTVTVNSLPTGTNNIGDVDVVSLPELPAGTNNIGDVDVVSLPSLPTGTNTIGSVNIGTMPDVDVGSLPALPAGTNNIGDVDVVSLPALPAGTNNIGDVDVVSLPALPAGTNNIGDVDVVSLPALPAGTNNIGDVDVASLPALPAGTNNIGDVDVVSLPALPAGTNNIGDVDVASISAGSNLIGDLGIQGRTTGGLTAHSKLDYASTPVDVKSSAGTVYALTVFNMTASPFYIKMYDVDGSVNRASHTPVLRFAVPANALSSGAGFVFNVPQGIAFSNRIQYAITTGVADTDTQGISSGNAVVNIAYK